MFSNKTECKNTGKYNFRISSHFRDSQDHSKSFSCGNQKRQGQQSVQEKFKAGKSINLPPVDTTSQSSKSCMAVDLLQLAKTFSKRNEMKNGIRRPSKCSGVSEDILGQRSERDGAQNKNRFWNSICSAPDVSFKQKRNGVQSAARDQSSTSHHLQLEDGSNAFASSWPMAPTHTSNKQSSFLPKIAAFPCNKGQRRRTNKETEEQKIFTKPAVPKDNADTIRGDFAKFNQSRSFRMRQMPIHTPKQEPLKTNCLQPKEGNHQEIDTANNQPNRNQENQNITKDKQPSLEVAKHKLVDRLMPRTTESTDSELTNVTEESLSDDFHGANQPDYEDDYMDELDRKCIKWLEDVARERLQNPDKVFLPHLLMS
ncbi:unnamed protein product [Clavelina lepadiformis]|uniref:Uncharacterized protein n=1 Tax=Clavelina lepadiformis TaxID=159417 RepID=A0ABP0F8S7_CLALP